jgi:DNA primase
MALIPEDTIAEIRARVDIVAVIGQHVQLRKAGRNWKGLCPFHGEKTPSFNVSPDKGFFYCFGCQKKGDAFTFVMELQGKSFHEAAEQLAAMAGVAIPQVEENPALRRARGERAQMLEVNKLATAFFREVLEDPKRGAAGRAYLDKRKIGAEQQERFQLGYAPGDWHALADFLTARRADLEIAVKLGLIARQPRAGGFYDRFRDRLVCPIVVPGGEVVGFSARLVGDAPKDEHGDAIGAKYINSPESTVYKKSRLLFGLAQAREGFRTKGRAVLVEGNFDVISMHQAGFVETIAPLGTALTGEQVDQIRRLASKVVLFYDGDRAGYRATIAGLELCLAAELPAYIARRPGHAGSGGAGVLADGADPDTVVHAGGPDRLAEMLDRAQPALEFLAYEVWTLAKTPESKARAIDDAARLLRKVASTTERDLIAGTLATAMQLDPGVVQRALARASRPDGAAHPGGPAPSGRYGAPPSGGAGGPGAPEPAAAPPAAPPPTDELDLLCLLADHPGLAATAEESGVLSLLTDERLRDMYSASRAGQSLLELAPLRLPMPSAQAVIAARFASDPDPARHLEKMVAGLRARQQALHAAELHRRLSDARRSGDRELERRIANEIVNRKQVD